MHVSWKRVHRRNMLTISWTVDNDSTRRIVDSVGCLLEEVCRVGADPRALGPAQWQMRPTGQLPAPRTAVGRTWKTTTLRLVKLRYTEVSWHHWGSLETPQTSEHYVIKRGFQLGPCYAERRQCLGPPMQVCQSRLSAAVDRCSHTPRYFCLEIAIRDCCQS